MDDFGNCLDFHHDAARDKCCRLWMIFHFYGIIAPGGCLHVACNEFISLKWPYNHH